MSSASPSAEPKPAGEGADAPRRTSKKASGSKQSSAAAGGAASTTGPSLAQGMPSTQAVHDIPRIHLTATSGGGGGAAAAATAPAEPKPSSAESEDTQRTARAARASKKRSSSSTKPMHTEPDAGGGPASAATGMEPAGGRSDALANADREKEKERARREAKKQRAREVEEQKRREALDRQVAEEAARQQEQRQREQRRQQELAALNANAEECGEEEYDDDGFENYDDDFEEPPTESELVAASQPKLPTNSISLAAAKPLAKAKAKGVAQDSSSSSVDASELKKIQQALQAQSKGLASDTGASSGSGGAAAKPAAKATAKATAKQTTTSSISSSIAGLKQSLDPRARRVRDILEARKMEVDKCHLFQQPPLSAMDAYLTKLRRAHVRQAFVQTNEGAVSIGVQTKPRVQHDKGMHFPDDIGLDDATSSTTRRAGSRGRRRRGGNQEEEKGVDGRGNQEEEDANEEEEEALVTTSTVRFFTFLEQAAHVCEVLVEENTHEAERRAETRQARQLSAQTTLSQAVLFPSKRFDQDALEIVLQGRALVALRFSPAVSGTLVTSYGPPSSEAQSIKSRAPVIRANKSITCVWDVNQLQQAQYVLMNEGEATTVCLGPFRELFVLVGTADGSLHVWDLRSRLALAGGKQWVNGDAGSVDSDGKQTDHPLQVYSPTYSTCGLDNQNNNSKSRSSAHATTTMTTGDRHGAQHHCSAIVAVEVVEPQAGDTGSGSFQFGSLDDRGVLVLWSVIEFATGDDALLVDKCVEIGGRIKLVVTAVIDTQQQFLSLTRRRLVPSSSSSVVPRGSFSGTSTGPFRSERNITASSLPHPAGPIATVLQFFPQDANQFLIGTATGLVLHGHRFANDGEDGQRGTVGSYHRDRPTTMRGGMNPPRSFPSLAGVVCVAFHPFEPAYFLVGYEDGVVALFHAMLSTAVATWDDVGHPHAVAALQWSPSRPAVFLASFSHGVVLAWDLTTQTHSAVVSHKLPPLESALLTPTDAPSTLYPICLSTEKTRTSRPVIAMRCGDTSPFQFQLHELAAAFTIRSHGEAAEVSEILASIF